LKKRKQKHEWWCSLTKERKRYLHRRKAKENGEKILRVGKQTRSRKKGNVNIKLNEKKSSQRRRLQ